VKVLVLGGAGVLGSSLTELLVEKGFEVTVLDVVRREEAWRLSEVIDGINYVWKSSWDLSREDVEGYDVIFDVGLEFPDRPMGDSSPTHTLIGNLMPPLRLLESVRRVEKKPVCIYGSSYNALYGHPPGSTFTEKTLPLPSNVYGWSKGAAENLYFAYHKAYGVPVIITRVGSAFSKRMRSDELVARLIIYGLKGRTFTLRSPQAKRLWTYGGDVLGFYEKLMDKLNECVGLVLNCGGNRGDRIVSNVELATLVKSFIPDLNWVLGDYEPGELINGQPVSFNVDSSFTRKLLGWQPKYSLEEGLREVVEWFKQNIERYV
jgi:nucleoside-diphosphate-sugar epimerase